MSDHPIYNPEAERSLLGCIGASEGVVLDGFEVTPDHFFHFAHRLVFETFVKLHKSGSPCNAVTVLQALTADELKKIGGPHELTDICFYPSPSQTAHFLKTLDLCRVQRRAQNLAQWISATVTQVEDQNEFCAQLCAKAGALDEGSKTENLLEGTIDSVSARLELLKKGTKVIGLPTPWLAWNNTFGGLVKGQLYALAGRPGTGKTAMMEEIIYHLASNGVPVVVFERDMSPSMLIERMCCRVMKVPYWRYVRGTISSHEINGIEKFLTFLKKAPIYLYSPNNLTAEKMCRIVRKEQRKHGIQAAFLDHIQALKVGKDIREGFTAASLEIRACVTETEIPFVVLAHLNRAGATGRPSPETIKEFDQLYGDCDAMALLWTDKEPQPNTLLPMSFYAAKNRNGPRCEQPMLFDGELMKFLDAAKIS